MEAATKIFLILPRFFERAVVMRSMFLYSCQPFGNYPQEIFDEGYGRVTIKVNRLLNIV